MMIKTDGERQAPIDIKNAEPSHLVRYKFALNYVHEGDVVLDVPCGTGYGAFLISSKAKEVFGIDIFKGAIDHAKECFSSDNVKFFTGDIQKLQDMSLELEFDVVVSFEGIEHLKNPGLFLRGVRELLKKEGLFIISTPRKPHGSPYHVKEYSLSEFTDLVSKYFYVEKTFGQIFTDIFELGKKDEDYDKYSHFNFILLCWKK